MGRSNSIRLLGDIGGGYEASIVTTYTAHLPFYEHVLLAGLEGLGYRQNMVVVDAGECIKALTDVSTWPERAGTRFILSTVEAARAFHPKLILLVGRSQGALYVGSHNATVSGCTYNRELTTCIRFKGRGDANAHATICAAWRFLRDWLGSSPDISLRMLDRVAGIAPWLAEGGEQAGESVFLGASRSGPSLWTQIGRHLPKKVTRCTIVSPYFDASLEFVARIQRDCTPKETVIAVDPRNVELPERRRRLQGVRYVNSSGLDDHRKGPVHAKAFLFEGTRGETVLVTGSANASSPAWTSGPAGRNAEAIIVHSGRTAERLAAELELLKLCDLDPLSTEDWLTIEAKHDREETVDRHVKPLIAEVEGEGFEFPEIETDDPRVERVHLLGRDGKRIGEAVPDSEGETLYCRVEPTELIGQTKLIEIVDAAGVWAYAVPHDARELERTTSSKMQEKLVSALEALATGTATAAALVDIANRLIFASGSWLQPDHTSKSRVIEPRRRHRARKLRQSMATGDLAFIIDFLSSRIGAGLGSAAAERSASELLEEEQLDETIEVVAAPSNPRLVREQADECSRKVTSLVRRIGRKIGRTPSEFPAAEVVVQLAGVLVVVKALRELDADPKAITAGATFVAPSVRLDLAWHALETLWGESDSLVNRALVESRLQSSEEVSLVRGLATWVAFDSQSPGRRDDGYDEEWQTVWARALFREALRLAVDDPRARSIFEEACSDIPSPGATEQRLQSDIDLAERLARLDGSRTTQLKPARLPVLGDYVAYVRNRFLRFGTVVETSGVNVELIDFSRPDRTIPYCAAYVAPLDDATLDTLEKE